MLTAAVVKLVNTLDCGSSIREFESLQPPHSKRCAFEQYMLYKVHLFLRSAVTAPDIHLPPAPYYTPPEKYNRLPASC